MHPFQKGNAHSTAAAMNQIITVDRRKTFKMLLSTDYTLRLALPEEGCQTAKVLYLHDRRHISWRAGEGLLGKILE